MPPSYWTMFRTAMQIERAALLTSCDLAGRCLGFTAQGARVLAEAAVEPLKTPARNRQGAIEDAIWTAYLSHEETLRAITGGYTTGMLVFLNQLDMSRRADPAAQNRDGNIGNASAPIDGVRREG